MGASVLSSFKCAFFVVLAMLWPLSAWAAPYEKIELSPAGYPKGTLPLHQGVLLAGKTSEDVKEVAVVFFRRVGWPLGIGSLKPDDCKAIEVEQVEKSQAEPKEVVLPPNGFLKDVSPWFENTPRMKAFVSTHWTKPASASPASAAAPTSAKTVDFEVFVGDPVFFRPGATYCMVVLELRHKRMSNEEVKKAIAKLETSMKTYAAAREHREVTADDLEYVDMNAAAIALEGLVTQVTKSGKGTTTTFVDDIIDALHDFPYQHPPYVQESTPPFVPYAAKRTDAEKAGDTPEQCADKRFAKVVLGLLSIRSEGHVRWSTDGSYVTRDGRKITAVQVVDGADAILLDADPKEAKQDTTIKIALGLDELVIPPPPGIAGQPQTKPVSLLTVIEALEGRVPGERAYLNAKPEPCTQWGYDCLHLVANDSARAELQRIADELGAASAVLYQGRKDASASASSLYSDVYAWASIAFPNRSGKDEGVLAGGERTLAGMAVLYENAVIASKRWQRVQKQLEGLAGSEPRLEGSDSVPVVTQSLDQQTFVSNHVVPMTGLAFLFPEGLAEPSFAYYGGVQVFPWPNPVNEHLWSRCRRALCPDLLRTFAFELGLTSTATTRVPATTKLRGVGGSAAIPIVGVALHGIPYVTGSVGVAFTGERGLDLEGARWRCAPIVYASLSLQANIPSIVRGLLPNNGGTTP